MLIVQKYGGSSVADTERIKKVAAHVADTVKSGNTVVVVVSAMKGETDRLLKMANVIASGANQSPDRELDALIATGEMTSAALVAMALRSIGQPAISLTASQVRIVTDAKHQRAKMRFIETQRIMSELNGGNVAVITGFQGVDEDGNVTTIGRGGSDTSAVAIAAALHADCCEIYSDVDGLYSADPNVCKGAKKIDRSSYEELLETAGAGAKVVHMHAVELAAKHGMDLSLKLSPSVSDQAKDRTGTSVTREDINMEQVLVSTISYTSNEAKISITDVPKKVGMVARIFKPFAKANINVDMIVQNVAGNQRSDVSFTIAKPDLKKAMQLSEVAAKDIGAGKVEMSGDVSKVSIVGIGMRSHAGVAAKIFEVLAGEGIDIQMISTSEIKVSVVIDAKYMKRAVDALHKAFIKSS